MDTSALLLELYGRIPPLAASAVNGLDVADLRRAPLPGANSIAWLVWHIARLQDHHISELIEAEQLWVDGGWAARFEMEADPNDMGYGHTAEQVAAIQPEANLLLEYLAAAQLRSEAMMSGLPDDEFSRIVDERWDPPVSLGVRLVSVADDSLQHLGQANYLRGLYGV